MANETNNLGSVRDWLRACPTFKSKTYFGADFLKDDPEIYALYSVPTPLALHENILGQTKLKARQVQNFVIALRADYGAPVAQNLLNLQFFQDVSAWIWAQNAAQNFPAWDGGEIASIVPTITPVIMETGAATARYQIQIRVTYDIKESEQNG